MAEFERGQTFLDKKAINFDGTKGKYFIALSNAESSDDEVVCFVMNTENRMDKYKLNCNKKPGKFIIKPATFSFIKNYTSIMLNKEAYYTLDELCDKNIDLRDVAEDKLQREIKNCIDFDYLLPKGTKLIKDSFK
ncbi:MAG: hypothetical protein ABSG15_14600 [FCB group bacterium]|jgi:hypothetical protein